MGEKKSYWREGRGEGGRKERSGEKAIRSSTLIDQDTTWVDLKGRGNDVIIRGGGSHQA